MKLSLFEKDILLAAGRKLVCILLVMRVRAARSCLDCMVNLENIFGFKIRGLK